VPVGRKWHAMGTKAHFVRAGTTAAILLCIACVRNSQLVRPANVPPEATYVAGGKVGGWWQECGPPLTAEAVHCRIWNAGGLPLADEGFLPYDAGPSPRVDELKIDADPAFPGPDRIFLANKRVLLPKSHFEELKKFVDWLEDKPDKAR
jgi:hypothetical protein